MAGSNRAAGGKTTRRRLAEFDRHVREFERSVQRQTKQTPASAAPRQDVDLVMEQLHNAQEELHAQCEELEQTREILEQERYRYQELFDFAPYPYLVSDENGTIQDVNQAAGKLLNIQPRFLIGKPLGCYVMRGHMGDFRKTMLELIAKGNSEPASILVQVLPRHQRPIHAELTVSPKRDREKKITALHWTIRDVTAERAAQLRVQSLNAELARLLDQRTGQLQAASGVKDYFLAMISHELRTPLTPVLAVAGELAKKTDVPPEVKEDLELIQRNVAMEATLIDDLLDLTRAQWGKLRLDVRTVDCHQIIGNAVEMCEGESAAKFQNVHIELSAQEHLVKVDSTRLQQVLWNLLKNAIKFTLPHGSIWIRSFNPRPGTLAVEIQDNGVGIAPEALSRVFHAFEQERQEGGAQRQQQPHQKGLGLGLSISKALAEAMGGRLWATSEGRNKGSVFTMEFANVAADQEAKPVPAGAAGAAGTAALAAVEVSDEAPAAQGRILLVEDHADTARIMSRLLSNMGYSVSTAGSVAAALDLAGKQLFDLIISDIGLPDASGLDLMRRLREHKAVKGIALSGYGTAEDIEKSKDAGFISHVTKPVDFNQLRSEISRVMA